MTLAHSQRKKGEAIPSPATRFLSLALRRAHTSFTADRTIINSGEQVTLSWQSRFATEWSISPAPGNVNAQTVNGNGSVAVNPTASTTYTLTAQSPFGQATAQLTVNVAMVATHPVISEFMADNETVLADGDGDFPDWIEIFNPTGAPVQLAGHHLTDDPLDLTKWTFPSYLLGPGERVIVFASEKDPTPPWVYRRMKR